TTGLMTAELRGRLQAAVDAALAGQNEEAERRWNHVLARNIGIEVRDGAADGVRAVNRQTLAVYIDWLKTQTPETLVAMLDATVREPLYRMAPEMFPWEERTFTKTITVRNLQVMEEREFSLVDRTRAGEKVDIDGLDANGIKVEGMVTPAIRAKFNDAIKIMEENLARDSLYNGQTRQVLNRGFKVILVNDPAYFQNGKFEWNAATLHIGEISASSVENLSRDLIAIITQLIFPLPEPPAE
ncbi:MAG: hypothetical protein FWB78_08005, partial [Treponema sp.]|nr:hypothetical protein [Treponema sp.]